MTDTTIERSNGFDRLDLLRKSIEHEALKKALGRMLDEHEAIFDREGFASLEFANDYLEAARLLPKRTGNRIIQVENWINER